MPEHRGGYRTRFQRRGGGWGIRYPKAPSRIAREGLPHRGRVVPNPNASNPIGPAKPHFRATLGAGGWHGGEVPTWTESQHREHTRALAIGAIERGREGTSPCCPGPSSSLDSPGGLHPQLAKSREPRDAASGRPATTQTGKKITSDGGKNRRQQEKKKKQKPLTGQASGRPSLTRPHRDRPARHTAFRNPGPPHARGTGVPSPCPAKTPPPVLLSTAPPTAAARRGARGERETTPPARPQAPEGRPGALQGHQPRANSARTPNGGRRVRRDGGTPPPRRGEGRPARRSLREGLAESVRSVRETTGVKHRGRAGFRTPFPSLPHAATGRGAGGRGEGPAGRARRAIPFAKECPSLVWRGLGPARESATSPHRSSAAKASRRKTRQKQTRSKRACAFRSLAT